MTSLRMLGVLVLVCCGSSLVNGAAGEAGAFDLNFSDIAGTDSSVRSMELQSDARILIGGTFSLVNGVSRNQLARLDADGTIDLSFDPPVPQAGTYPHSVWAMAWQPDGKIIVAGQRVREDRSSALGEALWVVRLDGSGQSDPSFARLMITNFNSQGSTFPIIRGLALREDGKVYFCWSRHIAGSRFHLSSHLVCLNSDGTPDSGFQALDYETGIQGPSIQCFALQPDGKLLAGLGDGVVRLNPDGIPDGTFKFSLRVDRPTPVQSIAVQPNGQILIGGAFETISGVPRNKIARLQSNGSLDRSFDPALALAQDQRSVGISVFAVQSDRQVLLANMGLLSSNHVSRVNVDGSLDQSFRVSSLFAPVVAEVNAVRIQPDGKILVGGLFTNISGLPRNNIARLWGGGTGKPIHPTITLQPVGQGATEGQTVTFSVAETSSPTPAFQWLFNGSVIPGATNSLFVLSNIAVSAAGRYSVVVSNSVGQSESNAVGLTVTGDSSALQLVNPSRSQEQFSVTVPATILGKLFVLESKDSLADTDWTRVTAAPGNGAVRLLSDQGGARPQRFYRVRVE